MKTTNRVEELVIPTDLKTHLNDIVEGKLGYKLGEPWKYSEETLGVVVPILRETAPERQYITMYEVLKELNIKDTGSINQVELQNKSGMAIFVRAGTIFTGATQNRAAQHSGVYNEKEMVKVCCVHASHGISAGKSMEFGDIAPPSVTTNLMTGDQSNVWDSVRSYTSSRQYVRNDDYEIQVNSVTVPEGLPEKLTKALNEAVRSKLLDDDRICYVHTIELTNGTKSTRVTSELTTEDIVQTWRGSISEEDTKKISKFAEDLNKIKRGKWKETPRTSTSPDSSSLGTLSGGTHYLMPSSRVGHAMSSSTHYAVTPNFRRTSPETGTSDLLGHLQKIKNQSVMDDMMQKVPLFPNQVGAIIFGPVGVIALETFDHSKSWAAIKKEIIEKYGDKISEKQAEHLFELKPDMILPTLKKFIANLDNFKEKTIRKDEFSETREVTGEGIIGEYTLVKGQPIHVLLLKTT